VLCAAPVGRSVWGLLFCCACASRGPGGVDAAAGDSGSTGDAGAGSACSRAAQAATANVALLDAVEASLASATSDAQKGALVTDFLGQMMDAGGAPLITSDGGTRVAFVEYGTPQVGWSIAGTWNGWTPGTLPMVEVADSGLFVAEASLPRTGAYAYKPVDGTTFYEDLYARNVVWDGIDHQGPGQFNGVVYVELGDADAGRIVAWRGVHATLFDDNRDVFLYLPPAYDEASCPVLPSLYFTDGNESLTRVPFQAAADQQYAAVPSDSAVLAFVALPNQNVRMYQYTFGPDAGGDLYLDFLKNDLRPEVQGALRVCGTPRDTGMAGASLGGLMAGYGAFQMPDVFDYVGSQSGSFFWENEALVARALDGGLVPARWYLDTGCPDSIDNCISNEDMHAALESRGYDVLYIEQDGGQHDWSYWQPRLPNLLHFFRSGITGCQAP
jgi:enterochelin esterase family protein